MDKADSSAVGSSTAGKEKTTSTIKKAAEASFNVNNFLLIAAIGVLILTCFSAAYTEDGSTGPASKALWGYGLVTIALFGMLIYSYRNTLRDTATSSASISAFQFGVNALLSAGAPGTMLFIALCIISLNAQYYTQINKGIVAPEYYTYSGLAVIIVTVQLAATYRLFQAESTGEKGIGNAAKSLIYLLSMAGIVNAGIMCIILTFFSTDG